MAYKVVFFDIDGTLINEHKRLPQQAIDAVRELQQKGVETVIATGRTSYLFREFAEKLGIDSYVSINGSYVVHKGSPIFDRPIPRQAIEAFVEHARRHNHPLVFQGHSDYYANVENHPLIQESITSLRIDDLPKYDPDFWRNEPVYQILLHCQAKDEHLYQGIIPDLRLIRWHEQAMDVLPTERSKAQGIRALLQHLQVQPSEVVAFGDGLNDKEMLAMAGLGIAMGNAHDELKPFADYITSHVDEDGIGHGLRYAGLIA
ncbi:MAG: Cof-like hydrolase [Paenibacillus sp.]|nr:Cof-like hydrolase [Paenibacillus sp.]